eukprot:TRINITY_DN2696_c0_g1_i1.p1 TRINITY_DN2696_c0_g1~~TRINITY_DN2696_c0_g1_i1.p1  ORF type:complete len:217 (-),score=35.56 TRINITY_DN2696_c0_g1_i1:155-805(-)
MDPRPLMNPANENILALFAALTRVALKAEKHMREEKDLDIVVPVLRRSLQALCGLSKSCTKLGPEYEPALKDLAPMLGRLVLDPVKWYEGEGEDDVSLIMLDEWAPFTLDGLVTQAEYLAALHPVSDITESEERKEVPQDDDFFSVSSAAVAAAAAMEQDNEEDNGQPDGVPPEMIAQLSEQLSGIGIGIARDQIEAALAINPQFQAACSEDRILK